MRDLSLHVMDLVQNSITAGATLISIEFMVEETIGRLVFTLCDNGRGMDAEMVRSVQDPFVTTRTTRKVGLGIPLFKANAELTGGSLELESSVGKGTKLQAIFYYDSIDMKPLGDLAGTIATLVNANPETPDFVFACRTQRGESIFDTRAIKQVLKGVRLDEPEVASWIHQTLKEEIERLFGGILQ